MGTFEGVGFPVSFERWRWWLGIPRDFWIINRDLIGAFIKENGLKPVPAEDLARDDPIPLGIAAGAAADKDAARQWLRVRPFPGGLRIAHLHFKGELFQLTHEQWANFSKSALQGFHEKLDRAGTVDFNKLIEISDAVDSMH